MQSTGAGRTQWLSGGCRPRPLGPFQEAFGPSLDFERWPGRANRAEIARPCGPSFLALFTALHPRLLHGLRLPPFCSGSSAQGAAARLCVPGGVVTGPQRPWRVVANHL